MSLLRRLRQNRALLLLMVALVVAVSAMTSVEFFVERVDRALQQQGTALMAADLVVRSGEELGPQWQDKADQLGLQVSRQISFPSVVFVDDQPLLVQVKGVDKHYPLRGRLLSRAADGRMLTSPPERDQVYVDSVLSNRLGGDAQARHQTLPLGNLKLQLAAVIEEEPDRSGGLFQLASRVMMHYSQVDETGLLGPASRARYRFMLAGDATAIDAFRDWAATRLPAGARITDLENARPELRTALDRGQRFLALATLCASLLAGIAILLATRRYVSKAIDAAAIMRTIGMTTRQVLARHLLELLQVLLVGALLGILIGFLGQMLLASLVGQWFGDTLPAPGWRPVLVGLLYASILLPGFSLPVLLKIRRVSPMRVLRHDIVPSDPSTLLVWGVSIGAFAGLVFWQLQDSRLAVALLLVLALVMGLSVGVGRLLIRMISSGRRQHSALGMGLAALSRHRSLTQWQLAGFSVGITLLLVLGIVRVDLINTWTTSLSPTAPNHFLINIQPGEQAQLQAWFDRNQVVSSGMYATARGRLTGINAEPVDPQAFATERGQRLASREFSLGFSDQLQTDNRIIAGEQWPSQQPGFTVEQDLAAHLGLQVGSVLTFDIAGISLSAPVVSLRTISWDSFNVNFFVQGNEAMMQGLPVAYLNSIYLDGNNSAMVIRKLASEYPSVSVLDLRPLLRQIRNIMDKGALAIEAVFLFTLMAAVLVTLGAVLISREERAQEIAVLRTLGARRRQVMLGVLAEFGLLGLVAGLVSASLASLTGYLVALRLFDLTPVFNPWLWISGVVIGMGTLLIVGYLATRSLLKKPPLTVINAGIG